MRNFLMIAAAAFTLPGVALAHTGHDEVSGLASGILHPITGADHLLAMLAVALSAFHGALWMLRHPFGF